MRYLVEAADGTTHEVDLGTFAGHRSTQIVCYGQAFVEVTATTSTLLDPPSVIRVHRGAKP